MAITVDDVEHAYMQGIRKKATPHREPDFDKIKAKVGAYAPCKGHMWFIESCNTGYNGVLERWQFIATGEDGDKISFWADLLPRLIVKEVA